MQRLVSQGGVVAPYTPGSYFLRLHWGWNTAPAWTELNFRTAPGWIDACPQLTALQKSQAAQTAIVRQLTLRLFDGALLALAEEAAPGVRYNSVTPDYPVLVTNWNPALGVYRWWWNWSPNLVEFEVELWFDIPPLA